jgi:hypothetical protein
VLVDEATGAPRAVPGAVGLVVECYGHRWPLAVLDGPPIGVRGAPAKV